MKSELKKFKGVSIKTSIGQILFKQYTRLQTSEFDQIYFKTNYKDSLSKIYDLTQPLSNQRYNNQVVHFHSISIPTLYCNVHSEKFKYKKKEYGLILFNDLKKQQSIENSLETLSQTEIIKLTRNLLVLVNNMKQQQKIYYNIRPYTIFRHSNDFIVIDAELVLKQNSDNDIIQFIQGMVQKDWEYWPPQMLDAYAKDKIDYSLDLFAIGCILYQIKFGKYPFQTKLCQMHLSYNKIEQQKPDLIHQIIDKCLNTKKIRNQIQLKEYIDRLQKLVSTQNSPVKSKQQSRNQAVRKGSGNGILDNISSVFTKMLNETQGYFLNYIENNQKQPQQKYLQSIMVKLYRGEDKIQKLASIVQKYMNSIVDKQYPFIKFCLLMGNLLRRGPSNIYKYFKQIIKNLTNYKNSSSQIAVMIDLLIQKLNLYKRIKKCMSGNFYVHDVSKFNSLEIKDIGHMVVYLGKLVQYLKKFVGQFKGEIPLAITNFICDQIYDLVSMLVMCIIALRKDNQLQLRNDNLQQLPSMQNMINSNLKKISHLSNFTGAHAIYSIQNDYIVYQEQISIQRNPYYSSLQHFYNSSRGYKGLSLPQNYHSQYTNNTQKPILNKPSNLGQNKLIVSPEKKNYFSTGQQQDSDQQTNGQNLQNSFTRFSDYQMGAPPKNNKNKKLQIRLSQKTFLEKPKIKQEIPSITKTPKNSSVSFQDFINISANKSSQKSVKSCIGQENGHKKKDQFSIFFNNQSKDHNKVISKEFKKKQNKSKNKGQYGFDQFSKVLTKQVKKKQINSSLAFDLNFQQLSKMKSPPKFQNNPFNNQFTEKNSMQHRVCSETNLLHFQSFDQINQPPPVNSYLQNILKGLKLKELKDLLKKNQHFIIPYSELNFIKVIGSGSAGEVSSGTYKGQTVAIKKVKIKQNPNALKQFQRQLATYIKIKGCGFLLSLVGLSECNGDFYLVTQFCQYGSLFDLLHKNVNIALSWKQRLIFAIQIAEGMMFLHSMKPVIIHRDLKSLNVFVAKNTQGYKMKVADFGLSRSPQAQMMTTQLGTIHWMAPELLEGKQYSLKVDVYSYGVLLWQILARKTPYNNLQNPMAILKYVVFDKKRPDLGIIPPDCPKKLIEIVQKCWAHDPMQRPSFSIIIQLLKMINL